MIEQSPVANVPIRAGPAEFMRKIVESVIAAGYTEERICGRLGIESMFMYQTLDWDRAAPATIEGPADALIHLFLAGRALPSGTARLMLGEDMVAGLETLGLLQGDDGETGIGETGIVAPTVLFYPVEGRFIVSDLGADPHAAVEQGDHGFRLRGDAVYPGIARNTGHLLSLVPRDRCESFLDLCSGTAIAALAAARFADHAWAVDITERATRFAEFNASLNNVTNVTILQGDVYEPVSDRTFDFIIAHPPYIPSHGSSLIYRAGGHDGEHITRRVIEGLPRHLRPGGRFYCSCMLSDREEGTVEQRLRERLGPAQHEFDVFVIVEGASTPEEYFSRRSSDDDASASAEILIDELTALGVKSLVLCSVVIRRHESPRTAVTARRLASDRTGRAEVDWMIDWETAAPDPDLPARLGLTRVRISPAVRLELVSRPGDRTWVPERCTFRIDWPFDRVIEVPLEVAQFVVGCDGSQTIAQDLERAKAAGLAHNELSATAFAASLMPLLASGVLLIEPPGGSPEV